MMYRQGHYSMLYDKDLSCCVVEVPYKGNASALFILPDEGKMQQVESALAIETLAKWKTSFTLREIHLLIPKVLFSASYEVKEILKELGITDAFSDRADLSGITGKSNLKVSKALHKTVLEIHEIGTEAAAVTVVDISPRSLAPILEQRDEMVMELELLIRRMNSAIIYLCLMFLGLCTTIQGHHLESHDNSTVAALHIYPNIAQFAVTLYNELSAATPGKNVFLSPLSVIATLSLLSMGAKSTTHTQILEALSFNLSEIQEKDIHEGFHNIFSLLMRRDSEIQLDIGQALFLKEDQKPLKKFLDDIHGFYDAEVLPTKFQEPVEAEKQINDYVEKKTHGKIVQLVKGLDRDTQLVLVNYISFKGSWKKPFDPTYTTERDFFVDQETTVKVQMMHQMGWFSYYFDPELSCTVLKLDYNGTATAFFVLPERGKEKELEQSLSRSTLNKWAVHVSRKFLQNGRNGYQIQKNKEKPLSCIHFIHRGRNLWLNNNMKVDFFLAFTELCVVVHLSYGKPGLGTQQTVLFSLSPFNDTAKASPCSTVSDHPKERHISAFSVHNFTELNTNFGFNLYRKIALSHDRNIVFSPLSLSFALAIFLLASKGETQNQIVQSLNLPVLNGKEHHFPALFQELRVSITQNKEFTLSESSFCFIQKDFQIKEVFYNLSKQYFDMEYLMVDFSNSSWAKNIINEHIQQKSRGKISALFDAFDQQAKIILVNYILFQGKWLHPFSTKFTELETFYIDNYRTVQVPMMFKTDRVATTFDKNLRCVVLKLPYRGSAHMLIAMPEKNADYMSLEDHLTNELVESWLKTMETRKTDIYFPKFKLVQTYHMDQLLQDLGIKDLFSYKADLSQLTDQRYVKLSQVVQRAVIEVDEIGTEAMAATGSEIMAYSLPPTIRVNRPFLFMIYEETSNALLFVGRVSNPTEL
ncbi:hypothetical protein JRQ81_001087 [Phrynocephalus forsythii]|uniref:Serpin domain-containing protein n=1 Tax=Phrynocephalus forsythii TaxID=171643 RepID=A0A9Q1B831_9SAUR|nr:hypothetical protein JRQ81_001087 [Phrynocephalus forsythii]